MLKLLRKRRSIRKFTGKPISPALIRKLKEACLRSPTSRDRRPWKFFFITDKALLSKLSVAKPHGAEFLQHASLGVLICGDENRSDVWIEDCSIAAILLQMTAQSLGLGSCWIQLRCRRYDNKMTSEKYVQKVLQLQSHIKVECVIAIGYPAEKRKSIPSKALSYKKIAEFR